MAFHSNAESGRTRLINGGPGAISTIVLDRRSKCQKKDGEHVVICKKTTRKRHSSFKSRLPVGRAITGQTDSLKGRGWEGGGEERQGDDGITLVQRTHVHTHTRTHVKRAHDTVNKKRGKKRRKINTIIMNI